MNFLFHNVPGMFAVLLVLILGGRPVMADGVPHTLDNVPDGEAIFQQACFSCHGTGFYGAPVIGDIPGWEERLAKGEAVLLESTLQGLNSMPARGGCAACSDLEIHQAVRYLIGKSAAGSSIGAGAESSGL